MCLRVIVVVWEFWRIVESWEVGFEGPEEPFDFALCGWFSSGSPDVWGSMGFAELCELAWAVVAVELCAMVR